ncbi:hypothetical protein ACROYT_G016598 [Oculina patagonica]
MCILILLGNAHRGETNAEVVGFKHGKNESGYHCPSFNEIMLRWHEFDPFTHYNSSSKKLEGHLVRFMRNAFNTCCPAVQLIEEKVNATSSCEMEILIRQNHDDNPTVHFPIFSNRGEKEQFERRFIALFDSPGPAVLKFSRGLDSSSTGLTHLLNNMWKLILVCLLHAVIAGITVWALDHKTNPGEFPQSSLYGIGEGIWWAFVTMTTVGYGDKAPQSSVARVFAILWMLEGTVLIILFAARLTADLTAGEISSELNLIGKKVGVPLGMETFLTKEFNFGAEFEELDDFHDLSDSEEYYESLEYLLFFDYVMATELLEEGNTDYLVMERNIAHKFSVGMILTGDYGTEEDEIFFACWRREIVDNHEIEKALERRARKRKKKDQTSKDQPLDYTTWVIIVSAAIVVLCLAAATIREYRRLKNQNRILPMD